MDLLDQPYFALLRTRLDHLGQRQRVLAENMANVATPGFQPRDVDMTSFQRMAEAHARAASGPGAAPGPLPMAATHGRHMGAGAPVSPARMAAAKDLDVTIDGNAVTIEDQLIRAAETRGQYETSLALYQKGLQLIRMAARPPGR